MPEVAGSQIWAVGRLTDLGDVMLCQESLHESCRMGRLIDVMKLICSLGHCECDSHTVHKLSQRRLTADWLAPRESECSRMCSKVSSDWLQSYIKATGTVLEIFKMAGYFTGSPRICTHINPLYQHSSGRRSTTEIARPPEWDNLFIYLFIYFRVYLTSLWEFSNNSINIY